MTGKDQPPNQSALTRLLAHGATPSFAQLAVEAMEGRKTVYQYRTTVNQAVGPILDTYPGAQWLEVAEVIEQRGGEAKLERRMIDPDLSWLDGVRDENGNLPSGWFVLGGRVITAWSTVAEMIVR